MGRFYELEMYDQNNNPTGYTLYGCLIATAHGFIDMNVTTHQSTSNYALNYLSSVFNSLNFNP